jgi:hypothetical protein
MIEAGFKRIVQSLHRDGLDRYRLFGTAAFEAPALGGMTVISTS